MEIKLRDDITKKDWQKFLALIAFLLFWWWLVFYSGLIV